MQPLDPAVTPNTFINLQDLLTLGGATTATFVLSNAIQHALGFNPKWLALAIAEAIALGGAYFSHANAGGYFVAVINGALIYCTATGITHIGASATQPPEVRAATRSAQRAAPRRFLSPWF